MRLASRVSSRLCRPVSARPLVYGAWAWMFKVKLEEVPRPLSEYPSLTAFFTRQLRDGVRNVDRSATLVSPVDGAVVSVSVSREKHNKGVLSQVKGIQYHITDFLGIKVPRLRPGNVLYSTVLYLSPGDYHRFHSPCDWKVYSRTHFAGQLLPVNPVVARVLPSLFCVNERVAVFGEWEHGFFSYTAVGATNVGSIKLTFDPTVRTNTYKHDWHCGFSVNDALSWLRRPASHVEEEEEDTAIPAPAPSP
ncbi:phosphatidylserine decarboxylase, partial [archaeon]